MISTWTTETAFPPQFIRAVTKSLLGIDTLQRVC